MEGVVIRQLRCHEDQRGWLAEIFRSDDTDFVPAMAYLSVTKPGVARGPHEHIEQTDFFCFNGEFRLFLWDNRKESATFTQKMVIETGGRPTIAIVPPRVVHAYVNIGPEDGMVFNLPDRLFAGRGRAFPVDEIRYEDDPASIFRID